MSARSWIGWSLATLVIAVLAHMASMHFAPRFIMHVAMHRMGAVNTMHHQGRVSADSRGVVRPSPDLLYSACPFDLTHGPLLVTAPVPQGTYWSVSVFDADTNNVFALNDGQVKSKTISLVVIGPNVNDKSLPSGSAKIMLKTEHGLVLFRTLIGNEKDFARLDAVRRQAKCAPLNKP
jgi:uncharacterized membrane protein